MKSVILWALVVIISPNHKWSHSIAIDGIATRAECQRLARVLKVRYASTFRGDPDMVCLQYRGGSDHG